MKFGTKVIIVGFILSAVGVMGIEVTAQSISHESSNFRESGNSTSMLYAYSGMSLVGIVVGFFIIKKWRNRK